MIAIILAAGKGSRLGDYTTDMPKSLLPLDDGQTLLDYNIKILKKFELDNILVVTGFNSGRIEKHVGRYSGVQTVYNPFWNHCNVLGSLYMALQHVNDDFLFLHADTLAEQEIWKMLIDASGEMVLPYQRKLCGEEEMKVQLKKDRLIRISKEIPPAEAHGEFLGIAKFHRKTLPYFRDTAERLFKSGTLNQYMEAIIQEAVEHDVFDIVPIDIQNYNFVEVDFEEDYLKARAQFGLRE